MMCSSLKTTITNGLKFLLVVSLIAAFSIVVPRAATNAYALDQNKIQESPIVKVLCNAVNFISEGPGKVIAMLILISLAIALFLGKVTWGLAIAVGVGIGLMMGASSIMKIISGDETDVCAVATPPAKKDGV